MSNLRLRILTAVVGIPLVVGTLFVGGWLLAVLLVVVCLLAQFELYGLMKMGDLRPMVAIGLVIGAAAAIRAILPNVVPLLLIGAVIVLLVAALRGDDRPMHNVAATLVGVIYPTIFLSFLLDLRLSRGMYLVDHEAFVLTLGVLVLIWITDTAAYFVGKAVGRRPLAPKISPKKTWEGAIAGVLGALAAAIVLRVAMLGFLPWVDVVVVALLCGVVSQLGDLTESAMKRSVAAKDSGSLLPGHGGMLDRIDGVILVIPLVYIYLVWKETGAIVIGG